MRGIISPYLLGGTFMNEKIKKIIDLSLPFVIVGILVVGFIFWYSIFYSPNKAIQNAHNFYETEEYNKAINLFLEHEDILSNEDKLILASCYREIGDIEESIKIYKNMLKSLNDDVLLAKIKINIGNAEIERGNIVESLNFLKEAIELSENKDIEVNTHAKKKYSFVVSDFPIEDEAVMNSVEYLMDISHYEENTVELNYRIAKLIYHLGDYAYAEKFAQKAIDLDHRFSPAYRLKGEIYLKNGSYEKAITLFKKAIEYNLKDYESYRLLGKTYEELEKNTHAIFNYRQAISINPKDIESRFFLSGIFLKQNDRYAASSELMTILKIAPNSYYGRLAKEVLKKITPKFITPIEKEETNN